MITPVLLGHVFDHPVPAPDAEVHVDVGKGDTRGVEESLEDKPVLEGIDLGDPQTIGYQRPRGRAPPRPHRDPFFPGVAYEVLDDEEIGGQVHLSDHGKLVPQALFHLRRERIPEPLPGSLPGQVLQVLLGRGKPLGNGEVGEKVASQREFHLTTLRDLQGILQGLRDLSELADHLLWSEEVVVLALERAGIFPGELLAPLDVDEHPVGVAVLSAHVVHISGGHHRKPQLPGELELLLHELPVLGEAVILKLDVEAVFEDLGKLSRGFPCAPFVSRRKLLLDLARITSGKGDQTLRKPLQELVIHPGLVVKALEMCPVDQLHQVLPTSEVLSQRHEVVEPLPWVSFPLGTGSRSDVKLTPQNRFYPRFPRLLVELHRPGEDPVVGEGQGGHPKLRRPGHQLPHPAHGVEERVLGVDVQVYEAHLPSPNSTTSSPGRP